MTIEVVPADEASDDELAAVFGDRGPAAECRCQRYRLARGESFRNTPVEERAQRLREQTLGGPDAPPSGLIARLDGEAVGWCAVAPRASYPGLVRNASTAAWAGRDEDRTDPSVWAVTCVWTRQGSRRQGVGATLIAGAVGFAREHGVGRLEAYPITEPSTVSSENHPGLLAMYEAAGFRVVHRPSKRRAVVAVDF